MEKSNFVKHRKMTLSELRYRLRFTQDELAKALGVTSQTIKRWELGTRKLTLTIDQVQTLDHLLKKIGFSFDDLESDPKNREKELCST